MAKEHICLEYLPEYNSYGIADSKISEITNRGNTPIISLNNEDYKHLANKLPDAKSPTIAFLTCRETGYYTIPANYAKSIAQTGLNIRFLTYKENIKQMEGTDGLILPGGRFDSPDIFYADPRKKTDNAPGSRSYAYISSIIEAESKRMPMLGICAGAQMIGGMHGMKMYRSLKEHTQPPLVHKTKKLEAHEVFISPCTPLADILDTRYIETNSRHKEAMLPNDQTSDLKIYAVTPDGIPEAWGNEDKKILCIQWHPEDFAAQGDVSMQKIYDWIAQKANIYKYQKEIEKQNNTAN